MNVYDFAVNNAFDYQLELRDIMQETGVTFSDLKVENGKDVIVYRRKSNNQKLFDLRIVGGELNFTKLVRNK